MKKFLMIATLALAGLPAAAFAQETTPPVPGPAGAAASGHEGPGKMFKETDTNGDGMMSKAEFMAFHEKRFTEMDTNGDGQISPDEAKAKAKEWREKLNERRKELQEKKNAAPAEAAPKAAQ